MFGICSYIFALNLLYLKGEERPLLLNNKSFYYHYSLSIDVYLYIKDYYLTIEVTTPEPTVLPPSLIANLNPSSIAT